MKTRYLAILATLAFLGFSVPAAAHPCERDPGHKHCIIEDPQTTVTAIIEVDSVSPLSDPVMCMTTADSRGLGGGFPEGDFCKVTLFDTNLWGQRDYCLLAFGVKNTKKETSVMLWFRFPCEGEHDDAGVWRTVALPATIVLNAPGDFTVMEVEGSFQNVVLTKNHQPFKETSLSDTISIENIAFFADPPP